MIGDMQSTCYHGTPTFECRVCNYASDHAAEQRRHEEEMAAVELRYEAELAAIRAAVPDLAARLLRQTLSSTAMTPRLRVL